MVSQRIVSSPQNHTEQCRIYGMLNYSFRNGILALVNFFIVTVHRTKDITNQLLLHNYPAPIRNSYVIKKEKKEKNARKEMETNKNSSLIYPAVSFRNSNRTRRSFFLLACHHRCHHWHHLIHIKHAHSHHYINLIFLYSKLNKRKVFHCRFPDIFIFCFFPVCETWVKVQVIHCCSHVWKWMCELFSCTVLVWSFTVVRLWVTHTHTIHSESITVQERHKWQVARERIRLNMCIVRAYVLLMLRSLRLRRDEQCMKKRSNIVGNTWHEICQSKKRQWGWKKCEYFEWH